MSRVVSLVPILIADVCLATVALGGGPIPAETRQPPSTAAPAAAPSFGEFVGPSPLLALRSAWHAAEDEARGPTPIGAPGIDPSRVRRIAPVDGASGDSLLLARPQGPEQSLFTIEGHGSSAAAQALASSSPATETTIPEWPAIDIPLPPPFPAPANGALVDPLPTALEAAIDRLALHDDALNPLGAGDWRAARAAIAAFYAARQYEPVWVDRNGLSLAGRAVLSQLKRSGEDGLDLSAFALPRDLGGDSPAATLAGAETTIAEAVVAYAEQASGSRVAPSRISRLIATAPSVADAGDALAETAAAPDPAARLASFNPPQKGYRDLRGELNRLIGMERGRPRLAATTRTLNLAVADASPLDDAQFGPAARVDLRIGRGRRRKDTPTAVVADTAASDATGAFDPLAREKAAILANMEMWRWEPRDMGERRIEINVADFSIAVLDGDTVEHRARVIVGKPDTPTPIFSNVMRYVLINPAWQVPDSIIRKEILPRLASDPDYLSRHGYEMKMVGGRVTIRQPPGEDNALGRIAFMFPNEHSVYMHDTPSRTLFDAETRAFSHGCVRVEQPLRLAELVLGGAANGWSAHRIGAAIGGPERTVFLPRPLPIHIVYFTEFVDESGELRRRPDVYGLTRKVAEALSSNRQD